ncbi:MAG: hypothetical protein LBM13_03045, partial [Candidatus Ancillula sp.]|nr:hypothetical protein [Candidatus Ancillula sp.]
MWTETTKDYFGMANWDIGNDPIKMKVRTKKQDTFGYVVPGATFEVVEQDGRPEPMSYTDNTGSYQANYGRNDKADGVHYLSASKSDGYVDLDNYLSPDVFYRFNEVDPPLGYQNSDGTTALINSVTHYCSSGEGAGTLLTDQDGEPFVQQDGATYLPMTPEYGYSGTTYVTIDCSGHTGEILYTLIGSYVHSPTPGGWINYGGLNLASLQTDSDGTKYLLYDYSKSNDALNLFINEQYFNIDITKQNSNNSDWKLEGAKFKLYTCAGYAKNQVGVCTGNPTYTQVDVNQDQKIDDLDTYISQSGNGKLVSAGNIPFSDYKFLTGTTYMLIETESPSGHKLSNIDHPDYFIIHFVDGGTKGVTPDNGSAKIYRWYWSDADKKYEIDSVFNTNVVWNQVERKTACTLSDYNNQQDCEDNGGFWVDNLGTSLGKLNVNLPNQEEKTTIEFTKKNDLNMPLSGAKFDLIKVNYDSQSGIVSTVTGDNAKTYQATSCSGTEVQEPCGDGVVEISSNKGKIIFPDLPDGYYLLKEISAPNGYIVDSKQYLVQIYGGEVPQLTYFEVKNSIAQKPGNNFTRDEKFAESEGNVSVTGQDLGYEIKSGVRYNAEIGADLINIHYVRMDIKKIDSSTSLEIPGAKFDLYECPDINADGASDLNAEGDCAQTPVTVFDHLIVGTDGEMYIENQASGNKLSDQNLQAAYSYKLVETEVPVGFSGAGGYWIIGYDYNASKISANSSHVTHFDNNGNILADTSMKITDWKLVDSVSLYTYTVENYRNKYNISFSKYLRELTKVNQTKVGAQGYNMPKNSGVDKGDPNQNIAPSTNGGTTEEKCSDQQYNNEADCKANGQTWHTAYETVGASNVSPVSGDVPTKDTPLENVHFRLYYANNSDGMIDTAKSNGGLIADNLTESTGEVIFDNLAANMQNQDSVCYRVAESSTPVNMLVNENEYIICISASSGLDSNNEHSPIFKIWKTSKGLSVDLSKVNPLHTYDVNSTSNVSVAVDNFVRTYTVKSDSFYNSYGMKLNLTKVDSSDFTSQLSGASFDLYECSPKYVYSDPKLEGAWYGKRSGYDEASGQLGAYVSSVESDVKNAPDQTYATSLHNYYYGALSTCAADTQKVLVATGVTGADGTLNNTNKVDANYPSISEYVMDETKAYILTEVSAPNGYRLRSSWTSFAVVDGVQQIFTVQNPGAINILGDVLNLDSVVHPIRVTPSDCTVSLMGPDCQKVYNATADYNDTQTWTEQVDTLPSSYDQFNYYFYNLTMNISFDLKFTKYEEEAIGLSPLDGATFTLTASDQTGLK